MRQWIVVGALGGLIGGLLSELVRGLLEGVFQPARIGIEGMLWSVSLAAAAAAAYGPSDWVGRGLAGGATFGFVKGGLTIVFSLAKEPWPAVLGGEVFGGLVGGLLLAYLWRTDAGSDG
jgi:hypothetical protein